MYNLSKGPIPGARAPLGWSSCLRLAQAGMFQLNVGQAQIQFSSSRNRSGQPACERCHPPCGSKRGRKEPPAASELPLVLGIAPTNSRRTALIPPSVYRSGHVLQKRDLSDYRLCMARLDSPIRGVSNSQKYRPPRYFRLPHRNPWAAELERLLGAGQLRLARWHVTNCYTRGAEHRRPRRLT